MYKSSQIKCMFCSNKGEVIKMLTKLGSLFKQVFKNWLCFQLLVLWHGWMWHFVYAQGIRYNIRETEQWKVWVSNRRYEGSTSHQTILGWLVRWCQAVGDYTVWAGMSDHIIIYPTFYVKSFVHREVTERNRKLLAQLMVIITHTYIYITLWNHHCL